MKITINLTNWTTIYFAKCARHSKKDVRYTILKRRIWTSSSHVNDCSVLVSNKKKPIGLANSHKSKDELAQDMKNENLQNIYHAIFWHLRKPIYARCSFFLNSQSQR
jgi:hypothetical protein